jgi:hypothetical protein
MPIVNVFELKKRFAALQKEALSAMTPAVTCEAFTNWYSSAETFPYWLNRVPTYDALEDANDYGDEGAVYVYTVNSVVLVGYTTSEFVAENDDLLDALVPQVIEYIDSRAHLQSATYTDAMLYLVRASFVTGGYTTIPGPGGAQCGGAAFQWRCEFRKPITQAYY